MWVAFAMQKLLTFFSKKFHHICVSLIVNFNESLTNDVVSFEQLGPGFDLKPVLFLFYKLYSVKRLHFVSFIIIFAFSFKCDCLMK